MEYRKIIDNLPSALISRKSRMNLMDLCNDLPETDWIAFEKRLSPSSSFLDFMFAIKRDQNQIENFIIWLKTFQKKEDNDTHPSFDRLIDICLKWKDSQHYFNDLIDFIWLEFDIGIDNKAYPFIFFVFNQSYFDKALHHQVIVNVVEQCAITVRKQTVTCLQDCLNMMLHEMKVYSIGLPETRSKDLIRLVIKSEDIESILHWLKKINYCNINEFHDAITHYHQFGDSFLLHVDFHNGQLLEKIGLEIVFHAPNRKEKLNVMLRELTESQHLEANSDKLITQWEKNISAQGKPDIALYLSYIKINFTEGKRIFKVYLFARSKVS